MKFKISDLQDEIEQEKKEHKQMSDKMDEILSKNAHLLDINSELSRQVNQLEQHLKDLNAELNRKVDQLEQKKSEYKRERKRS